MYMNISGVSKVYIIGSVASGKTNMAKAVLREINI